MPIDNAANIGPEGIMMALTNLSAMAISENHQTVTIGAGVTWPSLYAYLDEFNVTANGIRSGNGGVVGAILGGGPFGFMAYEFGMSNIARSLDVCDIPQLPKQENPLADRLLPRFSAFLPMGPS